MVQAIGSSFNEQNLTTDNSCSVEQMKKKFNPDCDTDELPLFTCSYLPAHHKLNSNNSHQYLKFKFHLYPESSILVDVNSLTSNLSNVREIYQNNLESNNTRTIKDLINDCRLTEQEIFALCACKYLQKNEISKISNKSISKYLDKCGYPITIGQLKNITTNIKYKCLLPNDTTGLSGIVDKLKLNNFHIPELENKEKLFAIINN